jgi:hypothetical protein
MDDATTHGCPFVIQLPFRLAERIIRESLQF